MKTHLICIVIAASACVAAAQEKPRPATRPVRHVVSDVRVQTLKGMTYLYAEMQATFDQIPQLAGKTLGQLDPAVKQANVQVGGGPLFIYHGIGDDMSKPFKLQIGYPVADDTRAVAGFQLKKLPDFRCATVILSGSLGDMGEAYDKVWKASIAAGMKPTGETREAYLYWEGPDSSNNVIFIQIGIQ